MDNREEAALPSGSIPTFKIKNLATSDAQSEGSADKGGYSYIPRSFNLLSWFGRFANIIPEETDDESNKNKGSKKKVTDAFQNTTQISISVQSSDINLSPGITSEVKKLGLTADIQHNINNFEPRWVEVQPKYNCYGSRRHSIGSKTRRSEIEKKTLVAPVVREDNITLSKDDLDLLSPSTVQRMAEFLDDTGVDFGNIVDVPETSGTDSVLQMTRSPLIKRGFLFRRDDPNKSNDMSPFVRGGIFGSLKGMRRSSSTSKLHVMKDEENRKLEPYLGSNSSSSDVFESSKEFEQSKKLGHRRSSSMGSLQRLLQSDTDEIRDGEQSIENYKSKQSEEETTPVKSVKNHLTHIGKQSVSWATTSKVKHNRREKQMFTPTSF